MTVAHYHDLYEYNYWAQRRVWNCIEQLTQEQFLQDLPHSVGSLHAQCFHSMLVEDWWFRYLKEGVIRFMEADDYPDRDAVRAGWDGVERYANGYLQALTSAELERDVLPPFWENKQPVKVWQALVQVANHSTDHRSQMLVGIHQLGGPTVEQDFLGFLFDRQAGQP